MVLRELPSFEDPLEGTVTRRNSLLSRSLMSRRIARIQSMAEGPFQE